MIAPPKIDAGTIIFPKRVAAAGAYWANEAFWTVLLFFAGFVFLREIFSLETKEYTVVGTETATTMNAKRRNE